MVPSAETYGLGVAVVVARRGEVLLGLRRGAHGGGLWSIPGGRVEVGEDPAVAAARELQEETGFKCSADDLACITFTVDEFSSGARWVTLFYRWLTPCEGEPLVMEPDKCAGWCWFPEGELPRPLFQPIESFLHWAQNHHRYWGGP